MKEAKKYEIHFAPLQGFTDWIYRNTYDHFFGNIDTWYTPFVRVEKGNKFRNRDLRDIDPVNNTVTHLIPQLLPGNSEELRLLSSLLSEKGYQQADINLGCPFPLIVGQKKGAGMLPYPERVEALLETIRQIPEIQFSVKMRLGWEDPEECLKLLSILNDCPLTHITLHARVGKQEYKGDTNPDAFERFYQDCKHPLIYNGDLKNAGDIQQILTRFDGLKGVMIGRGLLSSPFLVKDFYKTDTLSPEYRTAQLKSFHRALFDAYAGHLQDERQLLTKMQGLWEYFIPETDHKILKKIKKATRISQYNDAIALAL